MMRLSLAHKGEVKEALRIAQKVDALRIARNDKSYARETPEGELAILERARCIVESEAQTPKNDCEEKLAKSPGVLAVNAISSVLPSTSAKAVSIACRHDRKRCQR